MYMTTYAMYSQPVHHNKHKQPTECGGKLMRVGGEANACRRINDVPFILRKLVFQNVTIYFFGKSIHIENMFRIELHFRKRFEGFVIIERTSSFVCRSHVFPFHPKAPQYRLHGLFGHIEAVFVVEKAGEATIAIPCHRSFFKDKIFQESFDFVWRFMGTTASILECAVSSAAYGSALNVKYPCRFRNVAVVLRQHLANHLACFFR